MDCFKHKNISGVNTCYKCGNFLCEECSIEIDGRNLCENCISKSLISDEDYRGSIHRRGIRVIHKPVPSAFLAVLFGMVFPGAGLMYLGLIKRGLSVIFLLFLAGILAGLTRGLVGIFIPVIYVTSLFVTYQTAKRIINGEVIDDSIDSLLGAFNNVDFFNKYKKAIFLIIALLIIISISGDIFSWVYHMYIPFGLYKLIGFVVVIYFIFFHKKDRNN